MTDHRPDDATRQAAERLMLNPPAPLTADEIDRAARELMEKRHDD